KLENDFDIFWKAYPRKEGKQDAKKHWLKTKPNLETVLQSLEWQVTSDKWLKLVCIITTIIMPGIRKLI
ncbi:MAG: hypothetical protein ACKVHI_12375, partial [Candidatus Puniceispirillales bacterium]